MEKYPEILQHGGKSLDQITIPFSSDLTLMFSLALILVKQYHYKIHPVISIQRESFFSERRGSEVDPCP